MNTSLQQAVERIAQLRAGFFGPGNRVNISALAKKTHLNAQCLRLWNEQLDDIGEGGQLPSVVLPRRDGALMEWYGIAFTLTQSRDLREQLLAFAGPSVSSFRGLPHPLDLDDPVEAAIAKATGETSTTALLGATDSQFEEQLTDALYLMARVRQSVEVRESELVISTGRVLRRFEWALQAGQRAEAEERLDYLRRHRRLDPVNLEFLEVQLRAVLGLWPEIIDLPHFSDLVQARRPLAVTRAILHALYAVYLAPFEATHDADGLLQSFEREVRPRAGTLFGSFQAVRSAPSSAAVKSFLTLAVFDGDGELRTQAWEQLEAMQNTGDASSTDRLTFWKSLADRLPVPVPPASSSSSDPLSDAARAVFEGDTDLAWSLVLPLEPSPTRAQVLLHCAAEMGSLDAQRVAQEAMEALNEAARAMLLANHVVASLWSRVFGVSDKLVRGTTPTATVSVPGNWEQWLDLVSDTACSDVRLNFFAAQGAEEWATEALVADADQVDALALRLDELSSGAQTQHRLLDGLPHLLRFLGRDEAYPRPAFKSLYNRLRTVLAYYGDTGDLAQWTVYANLVGLVLDLGVSSKNYKELLDETRHLWEGRLAVANLDAALDTLDALLISSCPPSEVEGRSELAQMVFGQVSLWLDNPHLKDETRRSCRYLAAEYGLSSLLPIEDPESATEIADPLLAMSNKVIAIYTLTEAAAIRARDLLAIRCPSCTVRLNHDKVGTEELQNLAQNSHIFVMVTASAKHAATNFIESYRANKETLLRVHSKGSSSILRALSECAIALSGSSAS